MCVYVFVCDSAPDLGVYLMCLHVCVCVDGANIILFICVCANTNTPCESRCVHNIYFKYTYSIKSATTSCASCTIYVWNDTTEHTRSIDFPVICAHAVWDE